MPTRKKNKTSFEIPEELKAAPQAGWVYRTEDSHGEGSQPLEPALAGVEVPEIRASAANNTPPSSENHSTQSQVTETPYRGTPAQGILDLTANTISSGLATIGNAMLLAGLIMTAPIVMGMRMIGFRPGDK